MNFVCKFCTSLFNETKPIIFYYNGNQMMICRNCSRHLENQDELETLMLKMKLYDKAFSKYINTPKKLLQTNKDLHMAILNDDVIEYHYSNSN